VIRLKVFRRSRFPDREEKLMKHSLIAAGVIGMALLTATALASAQ
jgi:hypothetical protein